MKEPVRIYRPIYEMKDFFRVTAAHLRQGQPPRRDAPVGLRADCAFDCVDRVDLGLASQRGDQRPLRELPRHSPPLVYGAILMSVAMSRIYFSFAGVGAQTLFFGAAAFWPKVM